MARLQVEHVIPRKHGGSDGEENLALACVHCNSHKGSNLTGIDPDAKQITQLFDPRRQSWEEHFHWNGHEIRGKTACGRTTVRVMDMNADEMVQCRLAAEELGQSW